MGVKSFPNSNLVYVRLMCGLVWVLTISDKTRPWFDCCDIILFRSMNPKSNEGKKFERKIVRLFGDSNFFLLALFSMPAKVKRPNNFVNKSDLIILK